MGSKLTTMAEAVARYVPDGASVALGLAWSHLFPTQPGTRSYGSGGAADIASLAQRLAIIMPHERHRLRSRVDFVTSPGYGYPDTHGPAGSAWRQHVGLPRGGPAALITTLAVFTFDASTGEALLQSYHPGTTIAHVQEQTGWPLRLAPDCAETIPPASRSCPSFVPAILSRCGQNKHFFAFHLKSMHSWPPLAIKGDYENAYFLFSHISATLKPV